MARYRKIDPRIWNDEKFAALSHEAQRMFFFVLTHPSMTALGAFRISRAGMAEELGLEGKGFLEPFTELFAKGLVKYDERAFLLFAPNFLKYNPPENPNVVKGWAAAVDLLPECPLKQEVILRAKACAACTSACSKAFEQAFGSLLKGFAEPFPKGMPKQEQEQEQEQKTPIVESKPINNDSGDFCPTVDDFGAAPETVPEPPLAATGAGVTRVKLCPFPDSLPEDWAIAAAKQRPDVSAEAVFLKLRDWLQERQPGQKRSMAMWLRYFLQWVTSERIVGSGKPLGREETPEEKQKFMDGVKRHTDRLEKLFKEIGRE